MGNNLKYIVYLTTNKINNKIYVGIHMTRNPDVFDGYLGGGADINLPRTYNKGKTQFHRAILKYGTSAFYRQTIREFDNLEDAKALEREIVNDEFIKREDTYNQSLGGRVPPRPDKVVYQFSLDGELIKEWPSIKTITSSYDVNKDRITMCVKDKRSFDNYYWSYEDSINVDEYRLSPRGHVLQYDLNGVLLNSFKSATEAAVKLDIPRNSIASAVYARTKCCGYYFLREDEDIQLIIDGKMKELIQKTPVFRYLLTGEFDQEFKSIKEAVKRTKQTTYGTIVRAIKNCKSCAGYKWSYIKSDSFQPYEEPPKAVKVA